MPNLGLSNLPHVFNAFKYRDRAGIVFDILKTVKTSRGGRNKTQIMQSANLNYVQTKKYLGYMLGCGYLMVTQNETYVVTEKGSMYLQFIEVQGLRRIR
jgi:predicted transcriptional regulator